MVKMPLLLGSKNTVFAGAVLAMCFARAGASVMAQDIPANNSNFEPKGLLVSLATANGNKPAQIHLNVNSADIPANAQLELSVEPTAVSNEKYIIVVSTTDGKKKDIGTFSFFLPPRQGEVQKFLIDAQPLVDAVKANNTSQFSLSVQLLPVNQEKALSASTLRVLGARWVGG
jgi:hypothetical protein